MSNYNTGNPVPSIDPRDLDDNATVFDELLNSTESSVPDRQGVTRKTWHQMELDAASLVSPNVAALAALTAAADKGVFFSATGPVAMGTYTLTSFNRTVLGTVDAASHRAAIGAIALTDTGAYNGSAAKLTTPRSITLTGDGSWTVSFDGSATVSAALTLNTVPVSKGGTGGTTQATARSGIGAAASGANGDITSLTALTWGAMSAMTLQNSWVVVSGRRAVYRKCADNVQLEIGISGGTATNGIVIATLPAGFRPPFPVSVPCVSGPNTALSPTITTPTALISTNGDIALFNCSNSGAYVSALISLT